MAGPSELRIVPVTDALEVFRIVSTDDRDAAEFQDSFRSSHEAGRRPRRGSPEQVYRPIYQGISVFSTRAQAEAVAKAYPAIGGFVARLVLEPGEGFTTAAWGSVGHLSAWGEPTSFVGAVADIFQVEEN